MARKGQQLDSFERSTQENSLVFVAQDIPPNTSIISRHIMLSDVLIRLFYSYITYLSHNLVLLWLGSTIGFGRNCLDKQPPVYSQLSHQLLHRARNRTLRSCTQVVTHRSNSVLYSCVGRLHTLKAYLSIAFIAFDVQLIASEIQHSISPP
nr:MAG TPA: hypothetical protein [Caudoviricetes sp.]